MKKSLLIFIVLLVPAVSFASRSGISVVNEVKNRRVDRSGQNAIRNHKVDRSGFNDVRSRKVDASGANDVRQRAGNSRSSARLPTMGKGTVTGPSLNKRY